MLFLVSARIIAAYGSTIRYRRQNKNPKAVYILSIWRYRTRELRADLIFYNFFGLFIFLQKYRKIISYIKLKIEAAWSLGL